MRRLAFVVVAPVFMASAAVAADMPVKAAVKAPAAPVYNWTGLYLGGHVGGGRGTSEWIDDPAFGSANLGSHRINGSLGGGQIGYNWQFASWVAGVEADAAGASIKGNHVDFQGSDLRTKVSSLGTIAGRFGYAWDRLLLYFKGGGAWGHFKYQDFDLTTAGSPLQGASSATRWGYTVGGGGEFAFAPRWSAKVEYNYLGFGSDWFAFSGGAGGNFMQNIKDHIHVVKGGINYQVVPQ